MPGQLLRVQLTVTGSDCLIEVSDPLPAPPRVTVPAQDGERGRGLLLVVALADGFGHRPLPDGGKTVWARISRGGCG